MPKTVRPRAAKPREEFAHMGELVARLGDIPLERIRVDPPPGTATKRDLLRLDALGHKCLELIDGTIVGKPMGAPEAYLAARLIGRLEMYLDANDLGFVYGADVFIEVRPDQVRGPDVCFVSWAKRPDRTVPTDPISDLIPDLAVEVLSPSNTKAEIARKIGEFFAAGTRLIWVIDPKTRSAEVYTAPGAQAPAAVLDGGDVLPGFALAVGKLFERLAKPAPGKKPRGKAK